MSAISAGSAQSAASEAWGLMNALVASQRARFLAIASEFELAPAQVHALKALDPEHPLPMRELAATLCCDNSNVTGIVDRLEDRGLVERRAYEHDRRIKMLVVTDEGVRVRQQVKQRMEQPPEPLQRLSVAQQDALRDLMRAAFS